MKNCVVGVDVGGTNIKLGLVNNSGKIIARSHLSTKAFIRKRPKLIDALCNSIKHLIEHNGLSSKSIKGIGMGWPGLVNPNKGFIYFLPNMPGWANVSLTKIVQSKLRIPTFIDNDVKNITLAEWKYGAGRGYKNIICLTLGTGVGGGLILDNKPYRGEEFVAGEIGHILLRDKSMEHFIGNAYLLKKAKRVFRNKNISIEDVYKMAAKGNQKALNFWKEMGRDLGTVLVGVVNLLNPQVIILGGGVSNNLRFFLPAVKEVIRTKALKIQANVVKIVPTQLGNDAGILGGQILVNERLK